MQGSFSTSAIPQISLPQRGYPWFQGKPLSFSNKAFFSFFACFLTCSYVINLFVRRVKSVRAGKCLVHCWVPKTKPGVQLIVGAQ